MNRRVFSHRLKRHYRLGLCAAGLACAVSYGAVADAGVHSDRFPDGGTREDVARDGPWIVVEGDLRLSPIEFELRARAEGQSGKPPRPKHGFEGYLVQDAAAGRWTATDAARLSFAIDRASFKDQRKYELVRESVERAAAEWSALCGACGVTFVHVADLDQIAGLQPGTVVFVVRAHDAGGVYTASAFLPGDPPSRRFVEVDPSFFRTKYDKVGVFRHELGHVLGYRHEQIRPQAQGIIGCYLDEAGDWIERTVYDPRSVMHYFCAGGAGTMSLAITDLDRKGHQLAYAPRPEGP